MVSDPTALASQPVCAAITILGSGRLGPTSSALVGLVGSIIGGMALSHVKSDAGADDALVHWGGTAALALGSIGLVLGGLFLATADGGPGTGNGVVGSAVALVLGPVAIVLGGLANARRRDPRSPSRFQGALGGPDEPGGGASETL